MNRLLMLLVLILVPIAILSEKDITFEPTIIADILENDISNNPPTTETENDALTVMVSSNRDKSEAFSLDLEEYIIGVVAGEMPASFSMEALKAQAVAARTYAMYKMQNIPNYVLSASVMDQVYITVDAMKSKWGSDFDYYYNRIKTAVNMTDKEVLMSNDTLAITYYFAISNGYTDDGAIVFNDSKPYLVSVESSWDKKYSSYTSTRTVSKTFFCNSLGLTCDNISITNIIRATNNYIRYITINGITFTGIEVFNKLGLKSTDFTITVDNDLIYITTRGYGHGVGMSQYGAQGMAEEGYSYQDILTYYYKNTKLQKI